MQPAKEKFVVGIRGKSKVARLAAYESKDLENNRKSGVGLSYQDILGGNGYEPVFESRDKEECLDYMAKKLKPYGWLCFDHSDKTVRLESGKKMYGVVGDWAAGEIEGIIAYHTGNPKLRLPQGHTCVLYESTRMKDCEKYIREFYRGLEGDRKD